jgi:hypothetical protein
MRMLLLLSGLLAVAHANAQVVYKCADDKGRVAYMSQVCDGTSHIVDVYDTTPESRAQQRAASAELERRTAQADRLSEIAGTNRQLSTSSPGQSRVDARRMECLRAKEPRESTLRAVGMAKTYDLLRKIDETVYEACKGIQ